MTKKTRSTKERTLTDAQGREYPVKVLQPEIVQKDAVVKKAMEIALKLHERLVEDKQKLFKLIEEYLNKEASSYNLEWKGNALLLTFDEKYRIEMRLREKIQFGIELQLDKQKIDECIKAWTEGSNENLKAIVNEAFQVDKRGQIARYRILNLRRYNIQDPIWKEAMELIDKAIYITSTKQYISFSERDEAGDYHKVVLNFSAL